MHPHKCIHAYNTHTSPHTEMSASHSLEWSDEPIQVLPWSYYTSLLHCTKLTEHTRHSWKRYPSFLWAQRRPWNSSKPWCFYQLGKGIHLTNWKDRTINLHWATARKTVSQSNLQYWRGKEVFPDPGRNES